MCDEGLLHHGIWLWREVSMHCLHDLSELCNWRQNPLLHAPQDRHQKGLQGGIVQCSFREDSCRQGKYWSADANHHWHYN